MLLLMIISHFKMISRVMCSYIFSSQNVSQLHVFVFLNSVYLNAGDLKAHKSNHLTPTAIPVFTLLCFLYFLF